MNLNVLIALAGGGLLTGIAGLIVALASISRLRSQRALDFGTAAQAFAHAAESSIVPMQASIHQMKCDLETERQLRSRLEEEVNGLKKEVERLTNENRGLAEENRQLREAEKEASDARRDLKEIVDKLVDQLKAMDVTPVVVPHKKGRSK